MEKNSNFVLWQIKETVFLLSLNFFAQKVQTTLAQRFFTIKLLPSSTHVDKFHQF
jgi:hypothetical protein